MGYTPGILYQHHHAPQEFRSSIELYPPRFSTSVHCFQKQETTFSFVFTKAGIKNNNINEDGILSFAQTGELENIRLQPT
jgi:hypothetical protein